MTKAEGKFDVNNSSHRAVNTKEAPKNIPKAYVFPLLKMLKKLLKKVRKVHAGLLEAEYNNSCNA